MQGQRSAVGSSPEVLGFDHGSSSSSDAGRDRQIRWNNIMSTTPNRLPDYMISSSDTSVRYVNASNLQGHNLSGWDFGESSSRVGQGEASQNDQKTVNTWSSSINARDVAAFSSEGQYYESSNILSLNNASINLHGNETARSFNASSSGFNLNPRDLNINSEIVAQEDGDCQVLECRNASKSGGSTNEWIPSAGSSSDPFGMSSGRGGFFVDESDGRPGVPLDGQRQSCKRKTLEGNEGQSSGSGISNYNQLSESSLWHAVPARHNASGSIIISSPTENSLGINLPEQVNPRLGLSVGRLAAENSPSLTAPGTTESSRRNFRLRRNASQQHDLPGNLFVAESNIANANNSSSGQHSLRSLPRNNSMDFRPASATDNTFQGQSVPVHVSSFRRNPNSRWNRASRINASQQHDLPGNLFVTGNIGNPNNSSSGQHSLRSLPHNNSMDFRPASATDNTSQGQFVPVHVSSFRRNPNSQWNGASSSRSGSSSSFAISGEREGAEHEASSAASVARNASEYPIFVPPRETRNSLQNLPNWNFGDGTAASSSRSGSAAGGLHSSSPSWNTHRNLFQYPRRFSEYVRRSSLSSVDVESGGQNSSYLSGPSSQEMVIPSGTSNHGRLSNSRSNMLLDRHIDGAFGIPYSVRTLPAASEGRSRLVSEIRNVLDLMRRGEGLRFEDVMILDQSVFFGMADLHDRHRDMRLDVDNMSYEELLALEERMGNVNTGLCEETILKQLKQRKHICIETDVGEAEPCCICQEEYNGGEDLGVLDCGHDFHAECIKQWLMHKNLCPICKTTGLAK